MNRLPQAKRVHVVKALVEGNSVRATVRTAGVAKNSVTKLLLDLGQACSEYQDQALRGLTCRRVQCDEIWAFCYAKAATVPEDHKGQFGDGDIWTWMALDADSKLVPTWLVGDRSTADATVFIQDLADRIVTRIQLTTDGHRPYLGAVEGAFGSEIDCAMLIKLYGADPSAERRYSPPECIGAQPRRIQGTPTPGTSPPPTWSGRTSRCRWECGGPPG